MKKYPRYFLVKSDGLKYIRLDNEDGFGAFVYRDGSNIFVRFIIGDLKQNYKEIPIYEAVLM